MNKVDGGGSERGKATLLADFVFERLHRAISMGEYGEEERLPSENTLAGKFAERRGAEDLAAIAAALQLMRDATERSSHREDADFGFHLAIAAAANNQYFETAMRALKDHIAIGMKFHGLSLKSVRGGLDHVFHEHTAIFEAIRDRDPPAARAAMAGHVTGSRDRLFEGRLLDLRRGE